MSVAESSKEDVVLEQVSSIYYPLCFLKDTTDVRALIDLGSEVNAITLVYIASLGVKI